MSLFKVVSRAIESAERVSELVRGKPARRLDPDAIPKPPAPPDPFVRPKATPGNEEKPLANPEIAAQVFGRRSCVFCGRAVSLLQSEGIDYRFINLDEPVNQPMETVLIRDTKQYTVPYIYLRGKFIGGYDELATIHRAGDLADKTAPLDGDG